ncbi:glutathione S-transferase family protein [Microvirga puerhi]|uniref:Glutathione S-transferase family protein n=1 Tax=Microvirga puerhi TaxID=2876078 RepID=A0ABS7VUL8_9HYPH|nr:glutathione S-transferase family protein [Microvirga puerhi]MBZ6079266.1 glutathione S-transferase family protein [Microvirga puerhi]
MLKLFYSPGAISLAAHIALEETGAPYELIRVDFKSEEQRSSAYLAINPQGRVPALVTSRGILTETPAILVHIAQNFPEAKLLPPDPWDFARMLSVLSYVASTVHVDNAHLNRGYRWADDEESIREIRRKAPEVMAADLRLLEGKIGEPWVLGEHYSVADTHLFVMSWWAEPDGVSLADLPNLRAHLDRMQNRSAVQKAFAQEGLAAR